MRARVCPAASQWHSQTKIAQTVDTRTVAGYATLNSWHPTRQSWANSNHTYRFYIHKLLFCNYIE